MRKISLYLFSILFTAILLSGCGESNPKGTPTPSRGATIQKEKIAHKIWSKEAATASLAGTVKLEGKAPRRQLINHLPECKALHGSKDQLSEEAIVGEKGELANVLVYVSKLPGLYVFETPTEEKLLDQVSCRYIPHVFGVMVDQKITFRNSDPLNHNVNLGDGYPNFSQPTKGMESHYKFEKPILGHPIQCNVHPLMRAYACVFDHPFYAVSSADGNYAFSEKLAPGKYTITVWHENEGLKPVNPTVEIEVKDGESKIQNFIFKPD